MFTTKNNSEVYMTTVCTMISIRVEHAILGASDFTRGGGGQYGDEDTNNNDEY